MTLEINFVVTKKLVSFELAKAQRETLDHIKSSVLYSVEAVARSVNAKRIVIKSMRE